MFSITQFGLFVWLGCFPSPRIVWYAWPPRALTLLEGLETSVNPIHLLRHAFLVRTCWYLILRYCSSPVESHGVLNCLVPYALIWKGCFHYPICYTSDRETDWPSPGAHWTRQAWSSYRRVSFWSSDQRLRSAVLSNSCPSSLWLADVAVTFVARHQHRKREKVLVLAMTIYPAPSYLVYWLGVYYSIKVHYTRLRV